MNTIQVQVDTQELDRAIEKASRLVLLLKEASDLLGSLTEALGQKSSDAASIKGRGKRR